MQVESGNGVRHVADSRVQPSELSNHEDYERRLTEQVEQYIDVEIHGLPEIFHYWSHNYLGLLFDEVFERRSIPQIYAHEFAEAIARTGLSSVVSLGSGDGSTEIEIAKALREIGVNSFSFEMVELSDHLNGRARESARAAGVEDRFNFVQTDVNAWRPTHSRGYAGAMANQSLHHFASLENVFDAIWEGMHDDGVFVSFDTIGRNGHQRWPEALVFVQFFWDQLPDTYKRHRQLRRLESPYFMDWDCSGEGFEGIRAQDILPLLTQKFGFKKFAAWGGVIDPFIDRGFGPNFNHKSPDDRAFIDRIAAANEDLLRIGFIKPTQMGAVMVKDRDAVCSIGRGLSPMASVRDPLASSIPPGACSSVQNTVEPKA